jgi:hypothetical protein
VPSVEITAGPVEVLTVDDEVVDGDVVALVLKDYRLEYFGRRGYEECGVSVREKHTK